MRKDKLSNRERELQTLLHYERYTEQFLERNSRPRQRYPAVQEALREVRDERRILAAEVEDGLPSVRRTKRAITVDDPE